MKGSQSVSPLHFGRGTQKVSLYSPTTALPYCRLVYRLGGKRIQRTFKDFKKAKSEAKAIAEKLSKGEVSVAQITAREALQLRSAQDHLAPLGLRLDVAASEYADAAIRLGKVKLGEAVTFYLRHHDQNTEQINTARLVEGFLAYKKSSGASAAYLRDLRNRTRSLIMFHDSLVSSLTPEMFTAYFTSLNFNGQNHNNQLRVICTLLNYAVSQGYLSDGLDLLRGVHSKKIRKASYLIYQPEEFEALLDNADPEMVPPLVLLGFCGVRPAEMRRLNWRDIRFETRTLVIDATQAKTASRRTVPLGEAALMWLHQFKGSEGLIWGHKSDFWSKALNRLHRKAGVRQLPNGLRHSYISYRLTLTGDVNRTALEAGNSASVIHSNYHALVEDPQLAQDWFEVGMESSKKQIQLLTA